MAPLIAQARAAVRPVPVVQPVIQMTCGGESQACQRDSLAGPTRCPGSPTHARGLCSHRHHAQARGPGTLLARAFDHLWLGCLGVTLPCWSCIVARNLGNSMSCRNQGFRLRLGRTHRPAFCFRALPGGSSACAMFHAPCLSMWLCRSLYLFAVFPSLPTTPLLCLNAKPSLFKLPATSLFFVTKGAGSAGGGAIRAARGGGVRCSCHRSGCSGVP